MKIEIIDDGVVVTKDNLVSIFVTFEQIAQINGLVARYFAEKEAKGDTNG